MADFSSGHLTATTSERGFARLPPIRSEYGGEARAYESSAASEPHIWLNVECPVDLNDPSGPTKEAVMHFTADNAWRLAEQLQHLVRNHYHGDATPEWVAHDGK